MHYCMFKRAAGMLPCAVDWRWVKTTRKGARKNALEYCPVRKYNLRKQDPRGECVECKSDLYHVACLKKSASIRVWDMKTTTKGISEASTRREAEARESCSRVATGKEVWWRCLCSLQGARNGPKSIVCVREWRVSAAALRLRTNRKADIWFGGQMELW